MNYSVTNQKVKLETTSTFPTIEIMEPLCPSPYIVLHEKENIYAEKSFRAETAIFPSVEVYRPNHSLNADRLDLKLIKRIRELATYEDGWKGQGSIAAPEKTIRAAEQFARKLSDNANIIEPFIGLDGDGDITFFWKNENLMMDLSIYEDGTYSYFAEGGNGQTFSDEEIAVDVPLPSPLIGHLGLDIQQAA